MKTLKVENSNSNYEREELIYVLDYYFKNFEIISGNAGKNINLLNEDNSNLDEIAKTLNQMHYQSGLINEDHWHRNIADVIGILSNFLYLDTREKKNEGINSNIKNANDIFNEYFNDQFGCHFKASGIDDELSMELFSFDNKVIKNENSNHNNVVSLKKDIKNNINGGEKENMSEIVHSELEKQEEYINNLENHPELKKQDDYVSQNESMDALQGVVMAQAFVRGIRDIGYKDTGTAVNELVDNSLQAGASIVNIEARKVGQNVDEIFIMDNGHGMVPKMLRAAAMWGGTHREGNRDGFGRYGYGLPSASVSQGKKFTIYSKSAYEGSKWFKVCVDLSILDNDKAKASDIISEPVEAELPDFCKDYTLDNHNGDQVFNVSELTSGTIVHWENLDKLKWKQIGSFQNKLQNNIATTYWRFLSNRIKIFITGRKVEGIDPLFLTPGMKDYDNNGVHPIEETFENINIKIGDKSGTLKIRFVKFPYEFFYDSTGKLSETARWEVSSEHTGLIVSRNGRKIDVLKQRPLGRRLQSYDNWWKAEIDFSAELDSMFSVTTSKQQIVLGETIINRLKDFKLDKAMISGYNHGKSADGSITEKVENNPDEPRPSERIAAEVQKLTQLPTEELVTRKKRANENKENLINALVREKKISETEAAKQVSDDFNQKYKINHADNKNAPFFFARDVGDCVEVTLNRDHLFYKNLYSGSGSSPKVRQALELFLFTISESYLKQPEDARQFYEQQFSDWSAQLNMSYEKLATFTGFEEKE